MPVTVVVGGQFGSEGKGKVVHEFARRYGSSIAVRVGGSNSGHTVIDSSGKVRRFRTLPTASILPGTISVIAAGSYIDPSVLLKEVTESKLDPSRLLIDPNAVLITDEHKQAEQKSGLRETIGSTLSGTGAAVISRLLRKGTVQFAGHDDRLKPFIQNTRQFLRNRLKRGERIIVEGTQGFGLSPLHSADYPNVTSRDTSAAGFLSEVGLSPLDVDEVVMVLRAFPIRVAGNSGPLPNETDWGTIARDSGYESDLTERTTVTDMVRRVARFDATVVRAAIEANNPSHIVLNHVDYIDASCRKTHQLNSKTEQFVAHVEQQIGSKVDFVGFGPSSIVSRAGESPILRNTAIPA
ncbi:MAG: adenylosuccinate synthetase [Proteobacteria bacterium]|nr:adenylosuccinate synthetase [Pseudomonadota bacterium]